MSTRSRTALLNTLTSTPPPSCNDSPALTATKKYKIKTIQQHTPLSAPAETCSTSSTVPNIKGSLCSCDVSNLTLEALQNHLSVHEDMIVKRISDELSKIRSDFFARLEQTEIKWGEKFLEVNNTITKIVDRIERLEANSHPAQMMEDKLIGASTAIANAVTRIDNIEKNTKSDTYLHTKLLSLQQQIEAVEKKEIAADAVLFGVPSLPEENLTLLFNRLCLNAKCKAPSLRSIFRSRPSNKKSNAPTPIILKFMNVQERNNTLKSISVYRKQQQRQQLSLRDLGIESANACYLNESLLKNTRTILHHAVRMRNNHQLFSAYTSYGKVFIKLTADGESFVVNNVEELGAAVTKN